MTDSDRYQFIGQMRQDRLNGFSVRLSNTQEKCIGQFLDQKLFAWGKIIYPQYNMMMIREGHFLEGNLDGPGRVTFPGVMIYEGTFAEDTLGGTITYKNGKALTLNSPCEEHFRIDWDGTVHEGELNPYDGHNCGIGRLTKSNGEQIEGNIHEQVLSGEGKIKLTSGEQRIGDFGLGVKGNMNWIGTKVHIDGQIENGEFKNGVLVNRSKIKQELQLISHQLRQSLNKKKGRGK